MLMMNMAAQAAIFFVLGFGFWVLGFGFWVLGFYRAQSKKPHSGYRVGFRFCLLLIYCNYLA